MYIYYHKHFIYEHQLFSFFDFTYRKKNIMGNAHATLTQAGLNIFSIELNVTVVLDPNLQKNYETYEHYGPRFQDSMSFNMYSSGSEINLPNVEYILDEVQETCWNIENNKEFMLTAEDMYVYVMSCIPDEYVQIMYT